MDDLLGRFATFQPASSGPQNPLSDAVSTYQQQQASAYLQSVNVGPDLAGRAADIARRTNLPFSTVIDNLDYLTQQQKYRDARGALVGRPQLAAWLSDEKNAAMAIDDVKNLARLSDQWKANPQTTKGWGDAPAPTFWNGVKGVATSLVEGTNELAPQIRSVFADWLPTEILPKRKGVPSIGRNYGPENDKVAIAAANAAIANASPQYRSTFARGLYSGTSSLAQMIPSVAAGLLTGNPEAGLFVAGVQTGVPAYNKYRMRGGSRYEALAGGALEGGIEVLTEKLPMGFIVDKLGKLGAGHFVSGFLGRELPGELAATIGQDAVNTAIANPNATWDQYWQQLPDDLVQTAIGTLIAGGFFTGVNHAATRISPQLQDQSAAIESAARVEGIMDEAAASKVRARDPEAFRQFIEAHSQGTSLENLYVPAEKLATYFQSDGMDYRSDDFWGSYSGQIDEGLATGGDVVIPTAAAAAHLSGTPAWEAIKADVRTSPGGMSLSEAKSLEASYGDHMEKLGAEVAAQHEADRQAAEPRNRIYSDIRDKLTNAGYTQEAAHVNAELVAQRYATRAQRMGAALAGNETQDITVNRVLPDKLGRVLAANPEDMALKSLVNVMRGGVAKDTRKSLLDWIKENGGIEDKGGDLKSMGLAPIKGISPKGARKLIRDHADPLQPRMLGDTAQENANTPDELAKRAQDAGYFPKGKRVTSQALFAAIEAELHGKPLHPIDTEHTGDQAKAAADDLAQILDQAGLDPATASIKDIKGAVEAYRQAQTGGYQQSFADGPRGQISFANGKSTIDLFQSSNMSTFAHEMGHQWLEELRADAESEGASDQIKADWQSVQDWFKANGHSLKDGAIPVDAHELWARGTERFLMEGKAPSSALRRVFDAFKSWMLHIYQVVDNLRAPITPEIRDVMQRLIATDDEIAQAREKEGLTASFDREQLGMSEEEYAAYQKLASDSRDEAHDALLYRTMATIRRARTKAWREEAAGVRADLTTRINGRSEFKALHLLRTGRMLDNPEAEPVKVRLDKEWLVRDYGEGILASLPKNIPPIYTDAGATNAEDVAAMTGFSSGDEMVRTLVALEDKAREMRAAGDKRSVRQALIDEETAAEMNDRHGDILNDGSIEQEALAAVHNDKQGEVIAAELRSLSRRANRQPTPYRLARDWAANKIAESTVQEATSGAALQRYARAAAKAGKAAEAAILSGDVEEAYTQKQAQMLNNALIAEGSKARDQVTVARDRLASYAKRRTIKSMDQDYLDQIHSLLEQVEFRSRSQASIDRQASFAEWAQAREAEGHDVIVPASFAESLGTTHWSRLTVEKMLSLDDAVKQIAHLGRFKQELLDGQEAREYQAVIDEALNGIGNLPPRAPVKFDPAWSDRIKGRVDAIDAGLLKMETIVDWLDGGNSNGVFNRMVFRPVAEAQSREQDMTADYFARIRTAMEAVPNVGRWQDRVVVPELIDRESGGPLTVTRQRLVAMALNMGNEGNIQRLTDGYGWDRDAVLTVLNRELDPADWQFVQQTWDTIETLWPQISEMERRVNGVEPDKVVATPIETSAGTLRGGYYPAIYDTTRDLAAERNAGRSSDLLDASYTRATTRASATKDRAAKVKRPILLDVGVINRHLGEVIHDITHREAIINANKFLSDTRVQSAVNGTLGPEIRKQFQPWLKHVANQWANERAGNEGIGKFMGKLRANTTAVGMGFRISTIVTQAAGLSNSQEVIGGAWLTNATAQAAAHPVETWKFVAEKSGEIRHRMETLDRDIGALIRNLDADPKMKVLGLPRDAAKFMYHGIGYADRLVVVPTWMAAYNKALAGGAEESDAIYEADKVVRQSQGAGAAKDLAAIMRGSGRWGEALKLSTMFYSYFSAVYQRQRNLGRDVGQAYREGDAKALPGLMARAWWLLVVPPILSQLISGRGPDDDDDWATWASKQMLFNSLGTIPFVRDAAQPAWDKAAGNKGFDYQLSPVQRAFQSGVDLSGDLGSIARGEETKHATKDTLEAAGYSTGLVPGQVASAAQFLVDVGSGSQSPDSFGEWYRGLTTGHAKKK